MKMCSEICGTGEQGGLICGYLKPEYVQNTERALKSTIEFQLYV
jgi:hypothetical protein